MSASEFVKREFSQVGEQVKNAYKILNFWSPLQALFLFLNNQGNILEIGGIHNNKESGLKKETVTYFWV